MSTLKKVILGVALLTAVAFSGIHFLTFRMLLKPKPLQPRLSL